MPHRFLLAGVFVYLSVTSIIWSAIDTRPPFWDMAYHQTRAVEIYDTVAEEGVGAIWRVPHLENSYPPLYHGMIALSYGVFGRTVDAAQAVNLLATAILLVATFLIARTLMTPLAAAAAAALVGFYPFMLWLSRETMIDYTLAAMVALAMCFLVRTEQFSRRGPSALFGVLCGLGMLTKPAFFFFVAVPALWAARRNIKNGAIAAATAAAVSAYWYVPALGRLLEYWTLVGAYGQAEGDPGAGSIESVLFYIRALEGYQLFAPLFLLFIAGIVRTAREHRSSWVPIVLWILGGWFFLWLLPNKDPRFSVPLLPAVAIVTAMVFHRRERWIGLLVPFLVFQHFLVSFGVRALPETVVIARGTDGFLPWNWNLYTQSYFDLWGAPADEDWRIEDVLDGLAPAGGPVVRIGLVPDIARFDSVAFDFYRVRDSHPAEITRLGIFDEALIGSQDFVIVSADDQGFAYQFENDVDRINAYVQDNPASFRLVDSFVLPNGAGIRIYRAGS